MEDIYDHFERDEPEPVDERDPDYTDAGHLRELPELLKSITLADMMTFYGEDEYDFPWN
jgi:hypothetical protein